MTLANISAKTLPKRRRTQAERREAGQRALIQATIACFGEKGFGATTIQDIVRKADCTTGAIQHHFGSKNGLYIAVLDHLLEEFKAGFERFPKPDAPLPERLDQAVAVLVDLYTSERYRAIYSLVLGAQHDPELRDLVAKQRRGALLLTHNVWRDTFKDTGLADEKLGSLFDVIAAILRDIHYAYTASPAESRRQTMRSLDLVKAMILQQMHGGQ